MKWWAWGLVVLAMEITSILVWPFLFWVFFLLAIWAVVALFDIAKGLSEIAEGLQKLGED